MSFAQSAFAQFMSSPAGRITRVVGGVVLIVWGYMHRDQTTGILWMIVGLVPLLAGALDVCVIAALLGGPFSGAAIRQSAQRKG